MISTLTCTGCIFIGFPSWFQGIYIYKAFTVLLPGTISIFLSHICFSYHTLLLWLQYYCDFEPVFRLGKKRYSMCVEFVSQDPDSPTDWLCTPLVCPLLSPATCLFSAIVLDCWSFWREFKNCISYYSSNTTIFHISLMAVCQIIVEFQHQPPASYLNIMKSYIENMGKTTPGLNLSSISFGRAALCPVFMLFRFLPKCFLWPLAAVLCNDLIATCTSSLCRVQTLTCIRMTRPSCSPSNFRSLMAWECVASLLKVKPAGSEWSLLFEVFHSTWEQ